MELTGKAKQQFEKWYFSLSDAMGLNYGTIALTMNRFYCLPKSMQWGVYQDWADSMVVDIKVEPSKDYKMFWFEIFDDGGYVSQNMVFKTRQEARDAAIAKLNEIINKQ